jgi:c-di-GMP-binding flagellar brake protein YcgR
MRDINLEINDLVQVRCHGDDSVSAYPSRIDDVGEGRVVLSWPTDRGIRIPIHRDQTLALFFVREDAVYSYEGMVEERVITPIPKIVVQLVGSAQRIQRREYFRVRVMLPVELLGTIESSGPPIDIRDSILHIQTHTTDLSGAGLAFQYRRAIPIGTVFETKLTLERDIPPLKLLSKVVSADSVRGLNDRRAFHIGLIFMGITEGDRSRIVRHVFKTQQTALIQ